MNLASLSAKNALRARTRTILTIIGVAVAVFAFVFLRVFIWSWEAGAEFAAQDRIATRHKVTFIMPLPRRYVAEMKQVPGVTAVTHLNWFGGKHPERENDFFATMAVDHETFFDVYDEVVVTPEVKEAFRQNRRGAIVGDLLAKKFGWQPGSRITILGSIFPGDWEFEIVGIYQPKRKNVDRNTFWFRWDYLNDSIQNPAWKDQIGWTVARIDDSSRSAEISKAIDAKFDDRDIQTLTMSERAMQLSFLAMFSTVLKAINYFSLVILLIMLLILGNTIAMGVRERTNEYGVMRAIGFLPKHVGLYVIGEGITIGFLGGLLGVALSYPFITFGVGRVLEEQMSGWFPYFYVTPPIAGIALLAATALGAIAAIIPAVRMSRLNVVDALRRVG